ncbi:LOW QUALITY PROTEIN: LY6G5C isoform 1, partial [Pan troglodytes]
TDLPSCWGAGPCYTGHKVGALRRDTVICCCRHGDYSTPCLFTPGKRSRNPSPWKRTLWTLSAPWAGPAAWTGEEQNATKTGLITQRPRPLRRRPHPAPASPLPEIIRGNIPRMLGKFVPVNWEPPQPLPFPKYLRCYRCLLETEELGYLLGSDICLTPAGSSCITLHIKNSSGSDVMVSDCRSKEQMSDCSNTRTSPVSGFWIFSQCCFLDFCNDPQNRGLYTP